MIGIDTSQIRDRWEIVVQLTNDDGSETIVTAGCRILDDNWAILTPNVSSMSVGTLLRIPVSTAKHFLKGLFFAIPYALA